MSYNGRENYASLVELCPAASGGTGCASSTCAAVPPGYFGCACWHDVQRDACFANATATADSSSHQLSRYCLAYTAPPGYCGDDAFYYEAAGNEAASTRARVNIAVTRCICSGDVAPAGLDVLLAVDTSLLPVSEQQTFPDLKSFVCCPSTPPPSSRPSFSLLPCSMWYTDALVPEAV